MMHRDDEPVIVFGQANQQNSDKWTVHEIERTNGVLVQQKCSPVRALHTRYGRHIFERNGSSDYRRADLLHGNAIRLREGSLQHFVPPEDFIEALV